jgi:hypothetical protein
MHKQACNVASSIFLSVMNFSQYNLMHMQDYKKKTGALTVSFLQCFFAQFYVCANGELGRIMTSW